MLGKYIREEIIIRLSPTTKSDVLRRDSYLGSAASKWLECEKKFFTDSKIGRSRKERFRYWIDVRRALSKPTKGERAQVTQLLPNWQSGPEERRVLDPRDTFVPDAAPGWLSQHPGARAPIAFLQEAAVVLGTAPCEDLWILRGLYGFKTCPTSLQTPRRKALWKGSSGLFWEPWEISICLLW